MRTLLFIRRLYQRLPFASPTKSALKDAFYIVAAPLIKDSNEYKVWRGVKADRARLERVNTESRTDRDRDAEEPPPRAAAWDVFGSQTPAVFGWDDYDWLRSHIREISRARSHAFQPGPLAATAGNPPPEEMLRALAFDPPPASPVLTVIVPIFCQFQLALECLTAIMRHQGVTSCQVIVVDDASPDMEIRALAGVRGLTYLRNDENRGFGYSCNRAARVAVGEYLLFLNSDALLTEGSIRALLDAIGSSDAIGAVGPRLVYPDGRLQEAGARLRPDGRSVLVGNGDDPSLPRYNYQREVGYASGACLLIRKTVFDDLGGFDEAFAPAYCEDVDLCLRLRERHLKTLYEPRAVVLHHLSRSTAGESQDWKMRLVTRNQQLLAERWQDRLDELNQVRLIAFYLPQFHPIPENDVSWGAGFTDWVNVTKARPNFVGHDQPKAPADLGYYDLRLVETLNAQAALARRYGLSGFCFYYYNFGGRRLLEQPLDRWIASGSKGLSFCLCWANESWTRHWDGESGAAIVEQLYDVSSMTAVVEDLIPYLRHPDYIRVDGRPLILIYRVDELPEPSSVAEIWRGRCRQQGIGEIYLTFVESFGRAVDLLEPSSIGFDASVEFPPHLTSRVIREPGPLVNARFSGVISDYRQIALHYSSKPLPGFTRFRTAMPSWDNTPRQQDRPYIFHHSTPGAFQAWLETLIEQTVDQNFGDEKIVFVNAWNEWAEGAYLEPDRRFGHGYLEAVRNALDRIYLSEPFQATDSEAV